MGMTYLQAVLVTYSLIELGSGTILAPLHFTVPPAAGASPRHGWFPDTCSYFSHCLLHLKNERGPYEAWLLKPRAPLRLPASLLSFWSKRRGQQETYYSLYGLCLGVHLPCCLGPQKKSPAPEKEPLYGHHSTRLKPPSRETGRERERDGGGKTRKTWMLSIKHWLNDWVWVNAHEH